MANLFRAYGVRNTVIPTFFIESTAPDNVDAMPAPEALPGRLFPIEPEVAIKEIATHLSGADAPNLVVMVHGFNNPQPAVLDLYARAAAAISEDGEITKRKDLVCVGYRWPSEKMGTPFPSCRSALAALPRWIFWFGVILALIGTAVIMTPRTWLPQWICAIAQSIVGHGLVILGLTFAGVVLCVLLLRIIVYFRDTYRATNYGAPDLIEIVRQIDHRILAHDTVGNESLAVAKAHRDQKRVQLSFIGHSMGGYVVTNAIRALTDLFADDASHRPHIDLGVFNAQNAQKISPKIGSAFRLKRFVLASPDIPAEALLSNRANFLASSLRRFDEAYLFSNEGDEVLRQISTLANYFSFPTTSWKFGFRLGNVDILSKGYGIIDIGQQPLGSVVRVGYLTLEQIYHALRSARGEDTTPEFKTLQNRLPEKFSYFDCTDYIEPDATGREVGLLTFALRTKRHNAKARMRWYSHLRLLFAYLIWQKPNVHGGYFYGALSQQLIYRLACLGYQETIAAYHGLPQLSDVCNKKQIRVLFSKYL
jgi:pimeloyl-ACP methyl ester carboxylesterase